MAEVESGLRPPGPGVLSTPQTLSFTLAPDGTIATAFKTPDRPAPQPAPVSSAPAPAESDPQFDKFASVVEPSSFRESSPSPFEEAAILRGRQSDVTQATFKETLLGHTNVVSSLADREILSRSTSNAAANSPWTSTFNTIATHFVGNAPLDIGIALVSGPLGAAAEGLVAANSLRGVALAARLKKAQAVFKQARINQSQDLGFKAATLKNAKIDTLEGLATGGIAELWLQGMGKEGGAREVFASAATDAIASPFFGFALHNARALSGKGYTSFRRGYIEKAAKDLEEVTSLDVETIKSDLDRSVPETLAEVVGQVDPDAPTLRVEADVPRANKAQSVMEAEHTRPPDVDIEPTVKAFDSPETRSAADDFNVRPSRRNFKSWLNESLLPEFKHQADDILKVIDARAEAAGMKFQQYMEAKKLRVKADQAMSLITEEGRLILTAPRKASSTSGLLHEIGHIVRSDLDGKHLTDLEKRYGVNKGQAWSETQEEKFAEDIKDFIIGDTQNQPRGIRRALEAFTEWVKNVYSKALGLPQTSTKEEVFAALLGEVHDIPVDIPSAKKELRVFKERLEEKAEVLHSPETPKKKESKFSPEQQKEIDDATKRNLAEQSAIKKGAANSIERTSTKVARTAGGRRYQAFKKAISLNGRLLGPNNNSLVGQRGQLGDSFSEITSGFARSAIDTADINLKAKAAYNKILDDFNWDTKRLLDIHTQQVEVQLGGANGGRTVKIKQSKAYWVRRVLESMDGFNKDKTKPPTENSAQVKLMKQGFIYKGRPVKVSLDQLKWLQKGGPLSKKEMELVTAIQAGYREAGKLANAKVRALTGQDFINPDNYYYVSQQTTEGDAVSGLIEAVLPTRDVDSSRGAFHARVGDAPLIDVNPIADMGNYINFVAETSSYAKSAKNMDVFMEGGGEMLAHQFGTPYRQAMLDLVKILQGDRRVLGERSDTSLSKIYSLSVVSQLGTNPSVILKQFSSAWTAVATGRLRDAEGKIIPGGKLYRDAVSLAISPKRLKAIEAEMDAANGYFKRRRESKVRWVELEEITSDLGVYKIAGDLGIYERNGKLNVKEVVKLAKEKGIKKSDAWIATLEKTTEGIQIADRAQIAAIWEQTKGSSEIKAKKGTKAYWDEVSELAVNIALESQPTQDIVSKSFNQMKRGIINKALTQYTTQTRKIAELFDKNYTTYINMDKSKMSEEVQQKAWEDLWGAVIPLMIQTGYAAAVGTGAATVVSAFKDQFKTEKERKRLEDRRDGIAFKFVQNMIQGTIGVTPVVGAPLASLANATLGGQPFEQGLPGFDQVHDMAEGVKERNGQKMAKVFLQAVGVPSLVADPTSRTSNLFK